MALLQTRYGMMEVADGDAGVSESLRQYGEWAERELQLMRRFISSGDHVLDIGSFIGTHALAFSQFVGESGKVTAFEPRKEAFELLVRNTAKSPNIECVNVALGDQPAWFELYEMDLSGAENFGGLALKDGARSGAHYFAEIRLLDVFAFDRVDFLKIDVEGMEADVMRGGRRSLIEYRPKIFVECNSVETVSGVLAIAKDLNFDVYGCVGPAFNENNWTGNQRDIFGGCGEASLILLPREIVSNFDVSEFRKIKVLDDVVSLLLRKSQYPSEVLKEFDGPVICAQDSIKSAELSKQLVRSRSDLDDQLQASRILAGKNAALEHRIGELDAIAKIEAERREHELAGLNARLNSARRDVAASKNQVSELLKEILGLRGQIHAREIQLLAIKQSVSWRVTAPLRAFSTRYPGLMQRVREIVKRYPALRRGAGQIARKGLRLARPRRHEPAKPPTAGVNLELRGIESFRYRLDVRFHANSRMPASGLAGKRVLCFGHVNPFPPRAGNEYRVKRMLDWLAGQGHDALVVIAPLPGEEPNSSQISSAFDAHRRVLFVMCDGNIVANFPEAEAWLASLRGAGPREFRQLLTESGSQMPTAATTRICETFCPDSLIEVLLAITEGFKPDVALGQYVFMTRVFPLLGGGVLKIVDTIDLFCTKSEKVVQYGVDDDLALSKQDEAVLLRRADVAIGIQEEEAAILRSMLPETRVICTGTDFSIERSIQPPPGNGKVLVVGSANQMNLKGLRDFLRFAWPLVRKDHPEAELQVVGDIGKAIDDAPEGVRILGRVDDLYALYVGADVVINPVVAGTGLKIKTVEGLCHLRRVIAFRAGIDGIGPVGLSFIDVATNWYEFSIFLGRALKAAREATEPRGHAAALSAEFSPERVYAELAEVLNGK